MQYYIGAIHIVNPFQKIFMINRFKIIDIKLIIKLLSHTFHGISLEYVWITVQCK